MWNGENQNWRENGRHSRCWEGEGHLKRRMERKEEMVDEFYDSISAPRFYDFLVAEGDEDRDLWFGSLCWWGVMVSNWFYPLQVNKKRGLTYSRQLKCYLRQSLTKWSPPS